MLHPRILRAEVNDVEFCPECGTRLVSRLDKKLKKTVFYLECPKCGYKKQTKEKLPIIPKSIDHSHEPIAIIGKQEQKLRTLPTVKKECPKCGNNEAYWILRQTRASDEPETRIYRCTKCDHRWRAY